MKRTTLILLTLNFLLLAGHAVAAVSNTGAVSPDTAIVNHSSGAVLPAMKANQENRTEGGFIFYNRQYISATMVKSRQLLLTFDDGPNPHTTPIILDILKRRNLKGIFFVVGVNVRKYPSIVKRIYDEGHTIGNHTFYHINLPKFSSDRIASEIRATNELVKRITGFKPTVFRPPYGALNHNVLEILRNERMDVMLWSVDPGDWRNRSITRTVENLNRQLHLNQGGRGGIVLLHDTLPSTANALEPFLVALTNQGLLPTPFGGGHISSQTRSYWASKSPVPMRWRTSSRSFIFPDAIQRPYLKMLLGYRVKKELSPFEILKAKKSGNLFKILLARSF